MALPRLPFMGIDPHLPAKVKYMKLRASLGNPSDRDLCGSLYLFWAAVFANRPDGNVSPWSDGDIDIVARWDGKESLARALRDQGWIEPDGAIHDWDEWGGFLYAQRKRSADRGSRYRQRVAGADDSDVTSHDGDVIHVDDVLDDVTEAPDNITVTLPTRSVRARNAQPTNQPTEPNVTEPNATEHIRTAPAKRSRKRAAPTDDDAAGSHGKGGPHVFIFEEEARMAGIATAVAREDAIQLAAALKACGSEEKYRAVCAAWFASDDEFIVEKWGYAGRFIQKKLQALLNGNGRRPGRKVIPVGSHDVSSEHASRAKSDLASYVPADLDLEDLA